MLTIATALGRVMSSSEVRVLDDTPQLALGGRPATSFAKRLMLRSRYVASGCAAPDSSASRSRRRHRRLGLSTQSPLRNDCLRSRAATDRDVVARSRDRDRSGLAHRSSRDQDRVPRFAAAVSPARLPRLCIAARARVLWLFGAVMSGGTL